MAQRVLSILLGSEIVKVCEASVGGKKKVQIYNAIDLVIPPGLCEDGVILNVDAVANAIREGLKGEGFTAKKLVFSLSSKRIASKEAIIPFCKENRIKEIVDINAPEYFPISNLENYVVNYSILEVVKTENIKNYRLSVTATPKEMVESYYALASAMRMPVVSIDFAGNAILQLLSMQTAGNEIDAILQIGSENTVVSIMSGKTMVMQRNVPYGRGVIVEAVSSARNVPTSVADMILTEENIANLASESAEVADSVRSLFSSVNRIIEFYTSRNSERPIEHIYMVGDVLSVKGLVELFNQEWDHSVELIEMLHGIEIKNYKNVSYEMAANYLANIGALIAPMNISIISEKEKKSSEGKMPWWILIFAVVISIAMAGGVLFIYFTNKSDVDSIQKQIDSYANVVSLEDEYLRTKAKVDALNNWYDSTKGNNESLVKFFEDLENVQPKSLKIRKMSSSQGAVVIEGASKGKASVAEFIIQLKKLEYIEGVHVEYINETVVDSDIADEFTISLTLKYDDPYAEEKEEAELDPNDPEGEYEGELVTQEEIDAMFGDNTSSDNSEEFDEEADGDSIVVENLTDDSEATSGEEGGNE